MRGLNNARAVFAYEQVSKVKEKKNAEEFRSLVRSVPAMIQMSGLGATVAFLYSKKQDKWQHKTLYNILADWSVQQSYIKGYEFMENLTKLDSEVYRRLTKELMQLMIWVKRFAEGMIVDEKQKQLSK